MSVNPFDSVMKSRSRAALDAGHHNTDVVNGLNQARFDTYGDSGQPPLSYTSRDQGLAVKVGAPPLTLDFGTNPESQVNLAGILKARSNGAGTLDFATATEAPVKPNLPKAPDSVAVQNPENRTGSVETTGLKTKDAAPKDNADIRDVAAAGSSTKRTPALTFAEFSSLGNDAAKFQNGNYDLSIKHTDHGSVFKHKYTADDFSTCTLASDERGISATVTDPYARKQYEEHIGADGRSTVSRYSYDDSGARKAIFASRKDVTLPDGTTQTFNYDKFGKVVQA